MKYLPVMFGSLLKSLLSAILLVGLLSAPVPVAFATGMGPSAGAQPMAMADMPGMGTMQAGGDCCETPELPPANCGKPCPMVFSCLSQCFTATAADTGIRTLLAAVDVVVWPLRDRQGSRLPAAGPYEPPRA